jgi:hypothetical protein
MWSIVFQLYNIGEPSQAERVSHIRNSVQRWDDTMAALDRMLKNRHRVDIRFMAAVE